MDRENVKTGIFEMLQRDTWKDIDKERHKFQPVLNDALALLKEQQELVRCRDCVHRGKIEKCVLAAIAAEKDYPLFMLDNRGEWYCADGGKRE